MQKSLKRVSCCSAMTQKVTKFEAHVPYVLNGRNMQKSQNALVVVRQ